MEDHSGCGRVVDGSSTLIVSSHPLWFSSSKFCCNTLLEDIQRPILTSIYAIHLLKTHIRARTHTRTHTPHTIAYGWYQWYCRFYQGRRCSDDARQISRWLKSAGPKGRFRSQLCNKILAAGARHDDVSIRYVILVNLLLVVVSVRDRSWATHTRLCHSLTVLCTGLVTSPVLSSVKLCYTGD